jgi:hypothetical protein
MPDTPHGQILIYQDGPTALRVRLDGTTVWLTQAQIAELYQTTSQNVTQHIKDIYDDGELPESATCKDYLQVRREGSRDVQRSLKHYSLDVVLAVGYRVRSDQGRRFRQWATVQLRDLMSAWHRAAPSAPITSRSYSPGSVPYGPASAVSIKRSLTSTLPASTTTPTCRQPKTSLPPCRISCTGPSTDRPLPR